MMIQETEEKPTVVGSYHQADIILGVSYDSGQMLMTNQGPELRIIAEQDFEMMPESDTVMGVITTSKQKVGIKGTCMFEPSCKQTELLEAEILPNAGIYTVSSSWNIHCQVESKSWELFAQPSSHHKGTISGIYP